MHISCKFDKNRLKINFFKDWTFPFIKTKLLLRFSPRSEMLIACETDKLVIGFIHGNSMQKDFTLPLVFSKVVFKNSLVYTYRALTSNNCTNLFSFFFGGVKGEKLIISL